MEILEPKISLLSMTCVINLLHDPTPSTLHVYLVTSPHTPCSSRPDLEGFCLQDFAKAVFSVSWTQSSLAFLSWTFQISLFSFLLCHLNYLYFCSFCFGGVFCILCADSTLWVVMVSCLSPQVRLCAPGGHGLALSPRWPPIRIRWMDNEWMGMPAWIVKFFRDCISRSRYLQNLKPSWKLKYRLMAVSSHFSTLFAIK